MSTAKLQKWVLWFQGVYTFITAVWPIVHIESFMEVSGYKTDVWLVKTVAILLLAIALCLFVSIYSRNDNFPVAVLALSTAIGLAYVDFFYVFTDTIPAVYAADGIAEVVIAIAWMYIIIKRYSAQKQNGSQR